MFGEISATPLIDELRARRSARREPTPRGIPDRVGSGSDLLAEPPGMDSDAATEQPLPVPASVASAPVPRGRHAGPALPIGILLYLASVGIVATATVGVLFGIGFSLLVQPPGAVSAGAGTRNYGSEVELLLSSIVSRFFGDTAPADTKVVPVPIRPEVPRSAAVAALPAAPTAQPTAARLTSASEKSGVAPPSAVGSAYASEAGDAPIGEGAKQPAVPAATNDAAAPVLPPPEPPSSSAVSVASGAPLGRELPAADIAEFLARGDSYLHIGDITSARLFYERAADAGSGQGAMRLGATFDPNFLGRAGLIGTRGDQARADIWYRRARSLGAAEAAREPKGRETK
jgi:hypothetical protein